MYLSTLRYTHAHTHPHSAQRKEHASLLTHAHSQVLTGGSSKNRLFTRSLLSTFGGLNHTSQKEVLKSQPPVPWKGNFFAYRILTDRSS